MRSGIGRQVAHHRRTKSGGEEDDVDDQGCGFSLYSAASTITFATSCAFERNGTCDADTVTVFALARFARKPCNCGENILSFEVITYQVGRSCHRATAVNFAANADLWIGFCAATITRASATEMSGQNISRYADGSSQRKSPACGTMCAAPGGGGKRPMRSLPLSPCSGISAAT